MPAHPGSTSPARMDSWQRIDSAPGLAVRALITTPAYPSLRDVHPELAVWGELRVDPGLAGLDTGRARPLRVEIGPADGGEDPWRVPVEGIAPGALAWHPRLPLVAGLALRGRYAHPWVADHRARTVVVHDGIRAATSLTGLGGTGQPPLAWCGSGLVLLSPAPATTTKADTVASEPGLAPVACEAHGPGWLAFPQGVPELAALAAVQVVLLPDPEGGGGPLRPLTGPLLVRGLDPDPDDGEHLLVTHLDEETSHSERLNWATTPADLSGRGAERVPPGSRRPLGAPGTPPGPDDRALGAPASPDDRAPDAPAPAGNRTPDAPAPPDGSTAPRPSHSPSRITAPRPVTAPPPPPGLALTDDEDTPGPLLLWLRAQEPGLGGAAAPCPGAGPVAHLSLVPRWPADATVDTLHPQITGAVRDALDALARRRPGILDRGVVVGGHSFGASLALYALASEPRLDGAVVHSGCYNRTLTPGGFQYERRPYWQAPEIYHAFSALLFAHRLDRPVLIAHGTRDPNPATPPEQAVGLYRGIVAAGGHARLVLLPGEGHTFQYAETHRTLAREHRRWLDLCARKPAGVAAHVR
ncbi:S9 family peptidase [Streptomyces sp. AHA2]|uniref:S9 family peptidase n=1 Tax=Streptomyces sp. AHA2 TaxID=3064526 RepID=UPI002FE310B1